jgi:hypothetical protein
LITLVSQFTGSSPARIRTGVFGFPYVDFLVELLCLPKKVIPKANVLDRYTTGLITGLEQPTSFKGCAKIFIRLCHLTGYAAKP